MRIRGPYRSLKTPYTPGRRAVVETVFENLDRFRKMHPAFGGLEAGRMIVDGLSAPLHDGALRYYEEQGLM